MIAEQRRDCYLCWGYGERDCLACLGAGKQSDHNRIMSGLTCVSCEGTGKRQCLRCFGSGEIEGSAFVAERLPGSATPEKTFWGRKPRSA